MAGYKYYNENFSVLTADTFSSQKAKERTYRIEAENRNRRYPDGRTEVRAGINFGYSAGKAELNFRR